MSGFYPERLDCGRAQEALHAAKAGFAQIGCKALDDLPPLRIANIFHRESDNVDQFTRTLWVWQ
jgi:hypothetical protein